MGSESPLIVDTVSDAPPAVEPAATGTAGLKRLERYYQLARRQAWSATDLPWGAKPVLPERRTSERWQGVWRSVLTQLLQADMIAVKASSELLERAEHREAKLYYTTMVQDEARHVETLLRLASAVDEMSTPNPYLDELAALQYESETLEEKVVSLQGFFEAMVIPFFHDISRMAEGSILADVCERLAVDDGIHHGSGLVYADYLMAQASPALRRKVELRLREFYPVYMAFIKWRPPERAWMSRMMAERDAQVVEHGVQFAKKLVWRWGIEIDV